MVVIQLLMIMPSKSWFGLLKISLRLMEFRRVFQSISTIPGDERPTLRRAPSSMEDTKLSSLTIKLHEPYWLLHEGDCEHFIVFDQIRYMRDTIILRVNSDIPVIQDWATLLITFHLSH
jgi:hypothetical protein